MYHMHSMCFHCLLFVFLVEKSMLSLSERIESPSTLFLISMEQVLFDENSNMILRNVLPERFKAAGKQSHHREDQMAHTLEKPVMVELLENTSSSKPDVDLPTAPTLRVSGVLAEECVQMTIPVDILGLVRWDVSLDQVATNLKKRISAQLRAIKDEMLRKVRCFCFVVVVLFVCLFSYLCFPGRHFAQCDYPSFLFAETRLSCDHCLPGQAPCSTTPERNSQIINQ